MSRLTLLLVTLASGVVAGSAGASASPGGEIAFWRKCGTGCGDLYVAAADGTSVRRLTRSRNSFAPAWSPDGTRLVFASDRRRPGVQELYVLDVSGGTTRRLTRTTSAPGFVSDFAPAWSPDGRTIAFVRARRNTSALHLLELGTGRITAVRGGTDANPDSTPAWSPDSRSIAFSSGTRIVVVPAAGGSGRTIARGVDPDWSEDGSSIAFTGDLGVVVSRPDGSGRRLIARGASDPAWAAGGRIAFVVLRPTGASAIAVANGDGSRRRLVTRPASLQKDLAPAWRP